jgi:hypothetical protein
MSSTTAVTAPSKDVPIGMDIFHCPGCAQTWTNANSAVKYATVATVGAYTAAPLLGEAGTTAAGDALFNACPRGLLNGGGWFGNWIRIGWGGVAPYTVDGFPAGGEIFRIGIGGPKLPFWFHIP